MRNILLLLFVLLATTTLAHAQTGTITGTVIDRDTGEPLYGVNILVRGTSFGAVTNFDGEYEIRNIRPGEYSVEYRYIGYERTLVTGIRVEAGEATEIDVELGQQPLSADEELVVIGERPIFDVERSSTGSSFSREQIAAAPVMRVEDVVGMTAGVVRDPTGLYIRGGRASETGFIVDGVSAQDPLAGTGFGLDLGSNAFSSVEVTTGGVDVEHGNATSGVVVVETQTGGDEYSGSFSHMRDNPGRATNTSSNFFTDTFELTLGGPEPITENILPALGINIPGDLYFFMTAQASMTNEFMGFTANQVQTSMIDSDFWSPRQDNRWNGMFKLTYRPSTGKRVEAAYQRSLTINQNTRMLQIVGDDVQIRPGHQFFFQENLDNANTYAHDSKLAYVKWTHAISSQMFYELQVSRLFTRLRADANGRHWRPESVDGEFDARSIVVWPVDVFEAGDDFNYVLPGPGFANN